MRLRHVAIATATVLALAGCAGPSRGGAGSGLDRSFSFWPPPPDEPRIQFLRSYGWSSDVEKERSTFDRLVFGDSVEVLPIGKPYGVEMWNGRVYVCDITNPGVLILDLPARETRLMVTRGVERMVQPTDIAIADDGTKYVVDRRLGRIFVFSADDRHMTTFGEEGVIPTGIAVRGDELFVPDFSTQSVLVLDRYRGTELRSIGSPGGAEGQFIRPLGVEVDAEGALYVSDVIRGRVQKFDEQGELRHSLGGNINDAPGSFVRPKHVSVDDDGILYVVDAAFQNIQMFNDQGELLMFFGGAGDYPGGMNLPAGITTSSAGLEHFADLIHPSFDASRLVIVTNQFGPDKVAVYALGRLREGHTIEDIVPYAVDIRGEPYAAPELVPVPAPILSDSMLTMNKPRDHHRPAGRRPLLAGAMLLAGAILVPVGCGERDAVRSYAVPKEEAPRAAVPPSPASPTATAAPGPMAWELPDGWESVANPNSMRFATLSAGTGDGRIEVAITQLGGTAGGVAANINRWRGQLGLAPQSDAEIEQAAERVGARGVEGVWVDLVSPDPHAGGGDDMRMFAAVFPRGVDTWFIKAVGTSSALEPHRDGFVALCESVTFSSAGSGAGTSSPAPPPPRPDAPSASAPLAWGALPEGWTADASPRAMSVASFAVSGGGQDATVTITPLGGAQDLLANVNRWRRQVGLGPLAALADEPPVPIEVAAPAQLVDVAGSAGHAIVVMSVRGGTTWFIKMSGPDPLVAGGREGFEAFVRSLRFDGVQDE